MLLLGSGVNSYLSLIMSLLMMMISFSLTLVPAMLAARHFGISSENSTFEINQFALGNIGGAHVLCKQDYIS